jgi:hypothetical protein
MEARIWRENVTATFWNIRFVYNALGSVENQDST